MEMPINDEGLAILEEFESFVPHAYPDPYSALGKAMRAKGLWKRFLKAPFDLPAELAGLSGAPWTIGLGFTKGVKQGDRMTWPQAMRRLAQELNDGYVQPIQAACTIQPTDNQLAAMACLAWNIGIGWDPSKPKPKGAKDGFRQSSVLRNHNRGDSAAAARSFALWNKAAGEVSDGLTRRRNAEAALYMKPSAHEEPLPMPQDVQPETSLAKSPIVNGTTLTTGAATLGVAAEAARSAADIRNSLGDWLPIILVVAAIAGAAYVIWSRVKQRRGGWA